MTAPAFETKLLRTERRPVPPAPSANACTLRLTAPLDPVRWQEALGPTVTWRIYGGEANTPADPDGWFLQRRDRLATSLTGVFCRTSGDRVTLDRHDADDDLWQAVRLLAARRWRVSCREGHPHGLERHEGAPHARQAWKWTSPWVAGPSGVPQRWTNVPS
ncbi:hypothetical protein VA596_21810 [Amycolatopsis sp., V23-08]|uniref:Uncharacterized protein n=1 Tax=Amycolatopsis heterodermiae TaxID=3110235 RepID=A0ABU5R7G9_9PSEU|nr:hypothetical protein [Amycolatopsis sp., V23-08]MEA5362187.1 hypothetical protein [Amycolatopsis sp., V23-08]